MNRSKYQCNINGCQASFTRPWRLEAHIRVHQGAREFFCIEPDCGKAYFMQQHLKRHIVTFHQRPVESKKSSTNTICLVESASHGNTNTNDNCTGAETPFSCPVCSKKFKKHQQLKSHEYEHTGIKPFKCDKCDKSFLVSSKLKRHQKIHEGYRCSMDGCQEHFNTWSELLSHKSKAHKKTYQCETCGRNFLSKGNWRSHCLTHYTNRDRYKCLHPGCERSYLRAVELDLHVLRVHKGVREMCQFDGCGKSFSCKAKLRRHARKHNPNYVSKARNPKTKDDNSKKPRADKDVAKGPRKSMISVLCGLKLSHEENKKLIQGGNLDLTYGSDTDRSI